MSKKHTNKEFFLSSWAVDNRITVYVITFLIIVVGIYSYITMPRESFPEIIENKIYISSIYPGNSGEDVEKLITKPLEDKFRNISGATKVTSNSFQDYCLIIVEFDEKIETELAKTKIKDKVDEAIANQDWPNLDSGSKVEPSVFNLNISEEVPILNINLKGNYTQFAIKNYADALKDDLEDISEIKEAKVLGVDDMEVEVAIDLYKMNAAQVSFDQVIAAIRNENITISGGNLSSGGFRNNVRIKGTISQPSDLNHFIIKPGVKIQDIAQINFRQKDKTSFTRESGQDVVMINLKKRAGTNMISAIEQAREKIKKAQETYLPKDLNVSLTSDISSNVEHQVNELSNHIIIGILLVMGVLMFSMGLKNAFFVGTAIPLSMLMAFGILHAFGVTLNTMVLFALVMGLGMLVDDGIVVVDNVYANMEKGLSREKASKFGIGEIAFPVITSTLTTLAAFFPLGLWPGTMGKFMFYFPMTLSVVLSASLFVAMIINASMTGGSMSLDNKNLTQKQLLKYSIITGVLAFVFGILSVVLDMKGLRAISTLGVLTIGMFWVYKFFLFNSIKHFQYTFFPNLEKKYQSFLHKLLIGKRPLIAFLSVIGLLVLSFVVTGIVKPKVLFFPDNIPKQAIVYIEYPLGTDINKTNKTTLEIEKKVINVLSLYQNSKTKKNDLVESVITQVGTGAGNPKVDAGSQAETPFKSKITVNFVEYKDRNGVNTNDVLEQIRKAIPDIAGAKISIEKDANGPPVGYPISIELTGNNYDALMEQSNKLSNFIQSLNIEGIEKLQIDVNKDSPELLINIDRETAGNLGVNTALTGMTLRRALFGQNVSTYKDEKDDYFISVRLQADQRQNQSLLLNQPITFQNRQGQMVMVPISTFAKLQEDKTFNKIKRNDNKRTMMIYSGILPGYNANEIVAKIKSQLKNYQTSEGISYRFGGEQEEQSKNMNFLLFALFLALSLVTSIIVFQFNSLSKTAIIMMTIVLSFSGVFLGLSLTGMSFVILMTMMGIISLAGVVVKNGIVLMDFFVLKLDEKIAKKGVESHDDLSIEEVTEIIILSGKERLRPVLLTATTAILGLIPLAIGLNFDIYSFLVDLNPHVYVGGDNVVFWGPLAWTIIYGLSFATFLTLIIIPVMFYIISKRKIAIRARKMKPLAKRPN